MMKQTDHRRPVSLLLSLIAASVLPVYLARGDDATNATSDADPASGVADLSDLGKLDLETLLGMEVISVSKKEQKISEAPAAIAVLTGEEIRRLGATSIPEALRAVPGLQVARVNAHTWAVSSRGFNDPYSNKLLVLVDGRTVYTPTFAGVYWDSQDLVIEDLDRIEVIRGPGGTIWGANAVNGVINIITKSAKETQGALISTTYGTVDRPSVTGRYGGQLASNLFYRVYFKYFDREGFEDASGRSMADQWEAARGGVRLDWEPSPADTLTLQGDYYDGDAVEEITKTSAIPPSMLTFGVDAPHHGGNVLGRWTHRFFDDSEIKLQAYYDGYHREHPFGGGSILAGPDFTTANTLSESRDTWDIELQHHVALGERQDFVWGAGFRYTQDQLSSNGSEIHFDPEHRSDRLFSFFVQDEITLVPERVRLTLGTKIEHNDYTGLELQPGGRLLWTPTDRQSVWASVARAVRTPSRLERDVRVNYSAFSLPDGTPAQVVLFGNSGLRAEELLAYEAGYRIEPKPGLSLDVAVFYNDYNLVGPLEGASRLELSPPPPHLLFAPLRYEHDFSARTYGIEWQAHWQPAEWWRLTGSYAWLHNSGESGRIDTDPENQAHLRSTVDLSHGLEWHSAIYYVDRIFSTGIDPLPERIPSYVRLDLGLTWRARPNLEFALWAQNVLDEGHPEFANYKTAAISEIPRTIFGKVSWRF